MAAILLQVKGARLEEILQSTETIRLALIPLAAANLSEDQRIELIEFLEADRALDPEDYDFVSFLRAERRHNSIIGRASGNRVLHLYMQISLELASSLSKEDDILFGKRGRYLEWREQRNAMLEAVTRRDPEIALIEARRCSEKVRQWLAEDQKRTPPGNTRNRTEGAAADMKMASAWLDPSPLPLPSDLKI
ncbi:hypothetical protein ASE00_13530 [Sphingomonas sp. Root710]|nr:hypothetical protein ASE00_13530 [Sphingomonas sp. Root710]